MFVTYFQEILRLFESLKNLPPLGEADMLGISFSGPETEAEMTFLRCPRIKTSSTKNVMSVGYISSSFFHNFIFIIIRFHKINLSCSPKQQNRYYKSNEFYDKT